MLNKNRQKIHVVIICRACDKRGSVAEVALKQAEELAKYFEITVVSDGFPATVSRPIRLGLVKPVNFDFLRRFCHVPNEIAFCIFALRYLKKLHSSSPFELIICQSHASAWLTAGWFKKRFKTRYLLVTHGDIFDRPKGTYDWRLTAFYKSVTPYAYRNADAVIALSPFMASCAIKGGVEKNRVAIIPNSINPTDIGLRNPPFFKDPEAPKDINFIKLLYIGRLSVEKGVDVLIRACKILKERNINFKLEIIGSGPLKIDLEKLAKESSLNPPISFLGNKDRKSLGIYYQNADLLCVPSLSEPLPTVALESLISGIPVIGSSVGGIPFLVKNGFNGILVAPGSPEEIAESIEDLVKYPEKLSTLKSNTISSVYPEFSQENIGKKIRDLIIKIVGNNEGEL